MLKDTLFLALPVAVFAVGALVVLLLAPGESDGEFRPPAGPVQVQRDEGVALALDGRDKAGDLVAMEQQLAGPGRVPRCVG